MHKHTSLLMAFFFGLNALTQVNSDWKSHQNFDFIPGDDILFEDHFTDDQGGEFPKHWNLVSGQGVIADIDSSKVFVVSTYYGKYSPRMKTKAYLPQKYTLEYDTWLDAAYDSNPGVGIEFQVGGEKVAELVTDHALFTLYYPDGKLQADLPKPIINEAYHNKWHHIAISVDDKQIKVYCDQYRVLVVPMSNFNAEAIAFTGNASEGMNMYFKDVKLAQGGNMNLLGFAVTDSKFITRGITFDVNKANIRPESFGTLNAIVKLMNAQKELKFEIGGHTDSDGSDEQNRVLSEKRAQAVRNQLIAMGIDPARLIAKGFGESMPLNKNLSPEEKALNRRVEFTKI